jgi:hypothetical protein
MTAPNPYDHEELFTKIRLGGVMSPGEVALSGHSRGEKWDIKEGDGSGGATTTSKGEKVAQFTATFSLWYNPADGVDHFTEWDAFLKVLRKPTAGKEKTALDIYHPDLAELEISSVVVEDIGGKQHDGKGGATVAVKFLEFRPPTPKGGTPAGSSNAGTAGGAAGGAGGEVDPNADAKAELDALVDEAKKP